MPNAQAAAHKHSRNPFHASKPIVYPTMAEPVDREKTRKEKRKKKEKLRADMVRRVDVPVRVNQMNVGGWLRDGQDAPVAQGAFKPGPLTSEPLDERGESAIADDDDDDEDELRVDRGEPSFPVTTPQVSARLCWALLDPH